MRAKWWAVTLGAVVLVAWAAVAYRHGQRPPSSPPVPSPRLVWAFEAAEPGFVVAAPCLSDRFIYLAAGHMNGFHRRGCVYAIDRATGRANWTFDRGGEMLPTASTPVLAGDRLLVGEGLHHNFACRLQCLDAGTGASLWSFPTGDHIEGGAAVAGSTVVIPAGNDGLYAIDVTNGKRLWNFAADVHVDSTPWIDGERVYAGSGPSRRFSKVQAFCLETTTGRPLWQTPVSVPAWGSPVVARGRVFVGLGNGRLTAPPVPPEAPAGGIACFDAATGAELWTFLVGDAVFGRPAIAGDCIVFGARNGNLYGVNFDGQEVFRLALEGPVMAAPVAGYGRVYAVSVPGRIVCVDPADGRELWRYELRERGMPAEVYSSPRLAGRDLYVAGELKVGRAGYVCLHRFELPE